jgi:hypothetical protein
MKRIISAQYRLVWVRNWTGDATDPLLLRVPGPFARPK